MVIFQLDIGQIKLLNKTFYGYFPARNGSNWVHKQEVCNAMFRNSADLGILIRNTAFRQIKILWAYTMRLQKELSPIVWARENQD